MEPKKKISSFEYAFLEIADPEEAKNYEPYTYWEEQKMRFDNIAKQEQELLRNMKTRDGQPARLVTDIQPLDTNSSD